MILALSVVHEVRNRATKSISTRPFSETQLVEVTWALPAPAKVVSIPFHGTDVQSVEVDGNPYAVFRPLVETFGLAYSRQLQKLKGKSRASVSLMDTQLPGDTQRRQHTVINLKTLTMWLATIDEDRVNETSRPLVVAYQNEVAEAVEAYWTKGGAINPRVSGTREDFWPRSCYEGHVSQYRITA